MDGQAVGVEASHRTLVHVTEGLLFPPHRYRAARLILCLKPLHGKREPHYPHSQDKMPLWSSTLPCRRSPACSFPHGSTPPGVNASSPPSINCRRSTRPLVFEPQIHHY